LRKNKQNGYDSIRIKKEEYRLLGKSNKKEDGKLYKTHKERERIVKE